MKCSESFSPSLLKLVGYAAGQFAAAGKTVGVCGNLAGKAEGAIALIGLGVTSLSVGAAEFAKIKRIITSVSFCEAQSAAKKICDFSDNNEAKDFINNIFRDILI